MLWILLLPQIHNESWEKVVGNSQHGFTWPTRSMAGGQGTTGTDRNKTAYQVLLFHPENSQAVQQLSKGAVQSPFLQDFKTCLGKAQDSLDSPHR